MASAATAQLSRGMTELHLVQYLAGITTILNRFAADVIHFSSTSQPYFDLDPVVCTGSSIMPQKKNPDIAELARGKSGRMLGDLTGLLGVLKGLPLAYDRDLQEDKEPIFDQIDTLDVLLPAMTGMVQTMKLHTDRMEYLAPRGFSLATDIAEWLVKKSVPFRNAHEISGECVALADSSDRELWDLTDDEFANIHEALTPDVREVLSAQGSVAARAGRGGTAPDRVHEQTKEAREAVAEMREVFKE